jgi:hypothetical protein
MMQKITDAIAKAMEITDNHPVLGVVEVAVKAKDFEFALELLAGALENEYSTALDWLYSIINHEAKGGKSWVIQ